MKLSFLNQNLINHLLALCYEAGDEVMKIYQNEDSRALMSALKIDHTPVTEADMLSNHIICNALKKLTPTIPIISEENPLVSIIGDTFWLIDPLDGTKEFIAHNPEFTINIALIFKGQPILGFVYAPAIKSLFWGGVDFGAFKINHQATPCPLAICSSKHIQPPFNVLVSKSHFDKDTQSFIDELNVHTNIFYVGSSLKFCFIADGEADFYPRLGRTSEWDTAAAQAVLETAGGYVVNTKKERLLYRKDHFLNHGFIASSIHPSLWG